MGTCACCRVRGATFGSRVTVSDLAGHTRQVRDARSPCEPFRQRGIQSTARGEFVHDADGIRQCERFVVARVFQVTAKASDEGCSGMTRSFVPVQCLFQFVQLRVQGLGDVSLVENGVLVDRHVPIEIQLGIELERCDDFRRLLRRLRETVTIQTDEENGRQPCQPALFRDCLDEGQTDRTRRNAARGTC